MAPFPIEELHHALGSKHTRLPLIVLVLGPHLPPGNVSAEAGSQRDANVLLTALLVPIALLVWVYFVYSLAVFRNTSDAIAIGIVTALTLIYTFEGGLAAVTRSLAIEYADKGTMATIGRRARVSGGRDDQVEGNHW